MSAATGLSHLHPGARVAGIYLVAALEPRSYGDGKACVVLTLCDASGRIESAPFWSGRQSVLDGIARGTVVEVTGEIQTYRGRRQLEIARIAPVAVPVDPACLLPSAGDPGPRWARLDRWRADIGGPRLAAVLSLFYDDAEFRRRYGQCPASTVGHHATIGGLLQHTCEVAAIGRAVSESCGADPDLVLAGALLHDIGKLEAYRWTSGFEVTDAGALLGHVALGLMMLARRVGEPPHPACTEEELHLLLHLVASHHGRPEFGATAPPMTLEAEVLHYADNASAKTASMAEALADPENFSGGLPLSTRGVWQLDKRRAYRGRSDWGAQKERPPSRG
ncbi:MAG TPA: HD domain-containing protein [Gemmatimonadales bacterium]|nr:HD domain-containing protein [Gemmatimonadales bacterium]